MDVPLITLVLQNTFHNVMFLNFEEKICRRQNFSGIISQSQATIAFGNKSLVQLH